MRERETQSGMMFAHRHNIGKPDANGLHPDRMSAAERLAEIGEILAMGLMRLRARQSRSVSADHADSYLDFSANQRGHGPVTNQTETMS